MSEENKAKNRDNTAGNDGQHRLVRLTWRKGKRRDGIMRLPETYNLHRGKERIAVCQRLESGQWFWYGGGINTANRPTDLKTAKRDAKSYILAKQII